MSQIQQAYFPVINYPVTFNSNVIFNGSATFNGISTFSALLQVLGTNTVIESALTIDTLSLQNDITITGAVEIPSQGPIEFSKDVLFTDDFYNPGGGTNDFLFGAGLSSQGTDVVAVGNALQISGSKITLIGQSTSIGEDNLILLGDDLTANAGDGIMVGHGANNSASNQAIIGGSDSPVSTMIIGRGAISATTSDVTIQPSFQSGTNKAGNDIDIRPGAGTGSGASGDLNLRLTLPQTSGSTLQSSFKVVSLSKASSSADALVTVNPNTRSDISFVVNSSSGVLIETDAANSEVKLGDQALTGSKVNLAGSLGLKTLIYSSSSAISDSATVVLGAPPGANITLTLPAGIQDRTYRVVNCSTGAFDVVLAPNGSENLYGSNSSINISAGDSVIITYDSTLGWY